MLGRRQLSVLIAATLLPVTLFAAAMLFLRNEDAWREAEHTLLRDAQTIAQAVDRFIAQETAALTVLTLDNALDRGDFAAFHAQATRAVEARRGSWLNVVLVDRDRQIVNTRLPPGSALPPLSSPAEVADVFDTARPHISGVMRLNDRFTNPIVTLRAPVVRDGAVRYAVLVSVSAWSLSELLREVGNAPVAHAMLLDRRDRIVALSDAAAPSDERIGEAAAPTPPDPLPTLVAQASTATNGWRVSLAVPMDTVRVPLVGTAQILIGTGLLALLLAGLMAAGLVHVLYRLWASEAERSTEQRIADIVTHIPCLIFRGFRRADGTTRFTTMAGGLRPVAGDPFAASNPPDMARLEEALRDSAATRSPLCFEHRIRDAAGDTRWLRCMATPQRTADGGTLWDGLMLDVTDLRQTEAALRDSENRLRIAQEAAGLASWEWDLSSGTLTWSDSLLRIFGLEPGAAGPDFATFTERIVHPDDRERVLANAQLVVGRQGSVQIQYRIVRPDGAVRWLECTGSSVADADGRARRVLGIVRDVTDRKRTEDALHAANAALEREVAERKRTETLLESLYSTAPVGLCVVDRQLRYRHLNERLAAINGRPVEEHIGRRKRDVLPPALAGQMEPLYRRVFDSGEPLYDHELAAPSPAGPGHTRHWLLSLHPLRQPDGAVYAVNTVVQEISERKAAEEALRTALGEARAAIAAKARFFAAASHDLRQPVQTLFLFAHALAERLRDHPATALVATMQQALEGLKVLIDTLLDISRLDSGVLVPEPADFPAVTLMQKLHAQYAPRMAAKGLKFRMVGCPAWIHSDALLLGRILGNLLDNALKYTDRGGVLIGCRRRGTSIRIEVWDTGAGIPLEHQVAIFDEFVQLGTGRRNGGAHGLGLGLSIVRRLARLLGHELTLRSRPGHGTVFAITVPLAESAADGSRPTPLLVAGGRELAVVVEDDHTILTALVMLLEEWGFDTIATHGPDDALERIAQRRRRPDLIIADYYLPGGRTGTEAIRQIRAYCNAPVPAIVLTSDTGPERALEVGRIGSHLLLKPVMPDVLHDLIQRVAGGAKR